MKSSELKLAVVKSHKAACAAYETACATYAACAEDDTALKALKVARETSREALKAACQAWIAVHTRDIAELQWIAVHAGDIAELQGIFEAKAKAAFIR